MDAAARRRHEQAHDLLRDEVAEAAGERAAELADRRGAIDAAIDAERPSTIAGVFAESRALIVMMLCVAVIVGAVVAVITGAWWWILVALVLHALGTTAVVGVTLRMTAQPEHADPRVGAALQARGVTDPDAALNDAIDVAAEAGDPDAREVSGERHEVTPQSPARDRGEDRRR